MIKMEENIRLNWRVGKFLADRNLSGHIERRGNVIRVFLDRNNTTYEVANVTWTVDGILVEGFSYKRDPAKRKAAADHYENVVAFKLMDYYEVQCEFDLDRENHYDDRVVADRY